MIEYNDVQVCIISFKNNNGQYMHEGQIQTSLRIFSNQFLFDYSW